MKFDNSKILKTESLEQVAGGTIIETIMDGNELYKRGLLEVDPKDVSNLSCETVRNIIKGKGYEGYKDNGGIVNANVYTDKAGNTITREQFWKNFDAENGTKVIRPGILG